MKKKKGLLKIFLTPILIMVLIQGMVPFLTLVYSGIKTKLEENTIRIDNHMLEKSQVILQNDMIEKWRSIYKYSDELSEKLSGVLNSSGADIKQFISSEDLQQEYLDNVFPGMIDDLQYRTVSGVFLILANNNSIDSESGYKGFFVRDSDPDTKTASNTDLLMEKGSKQLAHDKSISLDSSWSTDFDFAGYGKREADDFFYKPYQAAMEHKDSNMVDLGYWAKPFILEDHYMDNHKMISYSVPLKYDNEIYGVVGVEIATSYVSNYFSVKDLDNTLNAGYALGEGLYTKIFTATIACTILIALCVYLLVRYVTNPVYRLMERIRGGIEGIHNFENSSILEIDELHDVIENLTDAQKQTEEQLLEEKERYRIAVESSQDMFFTYRKTEKILELVNSDGCDGVWDCNEHPEFIEDNYVHPADRNMVFNTFRHNEKKADIEFRLCLPGQKDYIWAHLAASIMQDENGEYNRIVGCVNNITQRKLLEEAQINKQIYDSVTSFYRLTYGIEAIQTARFKKPEGFLAMTDIEQFTSIDEQYGLVFGELMLEQLSAVMKQNFVQLGADDVIYIRAGADQFLIWIPDIGKEYVEKAMTRTQREFAELTDENYLALNFKCGITRVKQNMVLHDSIIQVKKALETAKQKKANIVIYESLSEGQKMIDVNEEFDEIDAIEQLKQMSLSSLALNLFDKDGQIGVVLDFLAIKLKEKYEFDNIIITKFNMEYLSNILSYHWHDTKKHGKWEGIVHCTDAQYLKFIENNEMQKVLTYDENEKNNPVFGAFVFGTHGLIFHMMDGGQYSGSIILIGGDTKLLNEENEQKCLDEISAILQNRINIQRHDLSAQAKSEFLARMSHEIRTPMNGIIGMTEIALKQGQTEEKRVECLKKIESSSNYLLGLLNDILDMSKIESGKMKLVYGSYNLREILDDIKILMDNRMAEKNITFRQDIDLKNSWFLCDKLRINQVLVNLLSNAVKYSNPGGNVTLIVKETCKEDKESNIYFAVQDDGIGIAKDKQQLIFQSFEQADESEAARRQGTGLGLAICNRLVHMMDSDIKLESEINKGSKFSFSIVLKQITEEKTLSENEAEPVDFKGKRILVVEDNELNMEIIHTLLEDYGIIVSEAYNGKEAVECVKNNPPYYYDLILMDIMMPVMDGLEATREIRNIPRDDCSHIPIIAMSANAFDEDVKRSLASGMNAHLSKPVNIKALEKTLSKIMMGG